MIFDFSQQRYSDRFFECLIILDMLSKLNIELEERDQERVINYQTTLIDKIHTTSYKVIKRMGEKYLPKEKDIIEKRLLKAKQLNKEQYKGCMREFETKEETKARVRTEPKIYGFRGAFSGKLRFGFVPFLTRLVIEKKTLMKESEFTLRNLRKANTSLGLTHKQYKFFLSLVYQSYLDKELILRVVNGEKIPFEDLQRYK